MARPAEHVSNLPPKLAALVELARGRKSTLTNHEKSQRRAGIEAARANSALEGLKPDAEEQLLDELYIAGKLTLEETCEYYRNKYCP